MKSKQFIKRLIVSILLVYQYAQTTAAGTYTGLTAENVSGINEQTLAQNEEDNEGSKTTIIAATNAPDLDTTTLPADFQVDGRHAFINNQFVADNEEPSTSHSVSSSYNHLQHSSAYATAMEYDDQEMTHIKEPSINNPVVAQQLTSIPISDHDMAPFDDYEDEENDSVSDSQEILVATNDKDTQIGYASEHEIYQNNKLYDSSDHKTQTSAILAGSYYNNNFIPNTNLNTAKPLAQQPLTKPLSSYIRQPSHSQILQQVNENYNKPQYNLYNKLNISNKTADNTDMQTASPFSNAAGYNKRFKTVSSSIQYASTPLADLVFKFSVGLAKHSNSNAVKHSSNRHGNIIAKVKKFILK